jgi:hypothetical protein
MRSPHALPNYPVYTNYMLRHEPSPSNSNPGGFKCPGYYFSQHSPAPPNGVVAQYLSSFPDYIPNHPFLSASVQYTTPPHAPIQTHQLINPFITIFRASSSIALLSLKEDVPVRGRPAPITVRGLEVDCPMVVKCCVVGVGVVCRCGTGLAYISIYVAYESNFSTRQWLGA